MARGDVAGRVLAATVTFIVVLAGACRDGTSSSSSSATTTTTTGTAPTGSSTTATTASTATTATSQPVTPAGGVVLFAVELEFEDPSPGGQGVWVENQGATAANLSCWEITSAASGGRATFATDTTLDPGGVLHAATPTGLLQAHDTVGLAEPDGRVADQTPAVADDAADDQVWYRAEGGVWRFGRPQFPPGVSDGRLSAEPPPEC